MILITGLAGTSGRAFYDVLCREKFNEKIRVVIRDNSDMPIFENSPLDIELVIGDVMDVDFLVSAMKGCRLVFHIAAKNLSEYITQAVLASKDIESVIFVSSTMIYSKYYSKSRLNKFEPIIRKQLEENGIKYVFIRPTMIFGTTNDHNISVFIRWFNKYRFFPIVKHGRASIQPVCRLDLAEAYYKVLINIDSLKRTDYIVSGESPMELIEMFRIITNKLDKKVRFINIPFWFAKLLVITLYVLSFTKIDYREKLSRLGEDRAYPHDEISKEFGYNPLSFTERVTPLIEEIKKEKKNHK